MSLSHSPSISTNGLVFCYDQANIKSYKGPAVQNLANNISIANTFVNTGYSSTGTTEIVNIPEVGQTTSYRNTIQNNYTVYTPNSNHCCPSLHYWGGITVSPSTLYTYLILYKCDSGYTNPNYMYRYEYTSNGGSYVTEGGVHSEANRVHLGSNWYYAWGTFTTQATTNWLGHCGTFYYRYSNIPDNLSVAKVAIIQGNYSGMHPKYWPNTATTRSNTQTILDLTNNNTLTASSLTYNSNGTFSFNGNGNVIDCGNSAIINAISGTTNVTVESWVNLSGYGSSGYGVITHKGYPWAWLMENPNNRMQIRFYLSNSGDVSCADSSTHALNTWYHFVGTYDGTSMKFYRNGELTNTVAGSGTLGGNGINMVIGSYGGAYYSQGQIPIVKIYNRTLSAEEVKQNFNAHKERFLGYQRLNFVTTGGSMAYINNGSIGVTIYKTGDNNSWSSGGYCNTPFTAPCTIEFNKNAAITDNGISYAMIGWNEDPTTNSSYTDLDHASYPYRQDNYAVYNNGSQTNYGGTWDANTRFYIVYDTDGYIRHYNGSKLLYSANYGAGKTVYIDTAIYNTNDIYCRFFDVKARRQSWNGTQYV